MPFISNTTFIDSSNSSEFIYPNAQYTINSSIKSCSNNVLSILWNSLFPEYYTPLFTNNRGYFTDTHIYVIKYGSGMTQFQWTDIDMTTDTATTKYVPVEKSISLSSSGEASCLPIIGTNDIIFVDDLNGKIYRIGLSDATITKLIDVGTSVIKNEMTVRFSKDCTKIYMAQCNTSGTIAVYRYDITTNTLTGIGTHDNSEFDYLLDIIDDKYYIGYSHESYREWDGSQNIYYNFRITAYDLSTDTELDYYITKLKHYELSDIMHMSGTNNSYNTLSAIKPFPLKPVWLGWSHAGFKNSRLFSAYGSYKIRDDNKFGISYIKSFETTIMNNSDDMFSTEINDDEVYISTNIGWTNVVFDKNSYRTDMILPEFVNMDDGNSTMNVMCNFSVYNTSDYVNPVRPLLNDLSNQLLILTLEDLR